MLVKVEPVPSVSASIPVFESYTVDLDVRKLDFPTFLEAVVYLYRLKNWDYPTGNGGHTPFVGRLINQLVYEKLPSGVLEELRKLNPTNPDTKRRKWKHHQFLSEDVGQPDLRDHLLQVIAIMRGSPDWRNFEENFFRAFPGPKALNHSQAELDLDFN